MLRELMLRELMLRELILRELMLRELIWGDEVIGIRRGGGKLTRRERKHGVRENIALYWTV